MNLRLNKTSKKDSLTTVFSLICTISTIIHFLMRLIKLSIFFYLIFINSLNINAQTTNEGNWCGTDQYTQELHDKNPALLLQKEKIDQFILNNQKEIEPGADTMPSIQAVNFIIPVVFHVFTYNGQGYLSKADIENQMILLNENFQRLNPDTINTALQFLPYAADIGVEFRLAHLDPNGNCTDGIVRMETPLTINATDAIKSLSYWDSRKYLNIWIVENPYWTSTGGGYAQMPFSGINDTYGILLSANFVGSDDNLTHEVGHCFGLDHTFSGGCLGPCNSSGDFCCDTPPAQQTSTCNTNINTCSSDSLGPDPWGGIDVTDQVENFMGYNYLCKNMFTHNQKTRMYAYLNSPDTLFGLKQLTTVANLAFTGTADPYSPVACVPTASFSQDKELICVGDSVTFTDISYNATPNVWNWTFNGGSPANSTDSNPTITYNSPGRFDVTHQPSAISGSDLITKSNIITVSSLTADYSIPIIDGFEDTAQFSNDWIISNGTDSYSWEITNTASATGSQSIRLVNFFTWNPTVNPNPYIDYIISPSYDLSASPNKQVKFKYGYAKKVAGNTDKLQVFYSLDCGISWQLKSTLTDLVLATAPNQSSVFFVPTPAEWNEKTMDMTIVGSSSNIRFKFQFTSGGGNNIYLDDINISGVVGLEDFQDMIGNFNVYPNPTNSSAQISFTLKNDVKNLSIKITDMLGQITTMIIDGESFNSGKYNLKIDEKKKLSSGIYIVEFNADNNVRTKKLIIQ